MIKPTIGRKVWYFSAPGTPEQDATVIDVHGDRCVSLFVVNRGGTTSTHRSVPLVQEGDELPQGAHATWMPFQVGQAKAAAATAGDINPTGARAAPPETPYPVDTARPGANVHGIGPDTDGGLNPHFKG